VGGNVDTDGISSNFAAGRSGGSGRLGNQWS
jgi:hypothetical protein